ncbi:hypothetical protein BDZ94DRAFT_1311355 [Collybia nuda]|uniref:DUF6534 domain-containing protein n=1 Tax=Collybia nuda TaxID=64659 RepID=A0A9P5Y362_9AGAR|nr:hypothetical protein BDZ94DRAFT_1311355 [Collybia nuda]
MSIQPTAMTLEVLIRNLFGPVLIGLVIGAMLSGITVVQFMMFVRNSRGDPLGQKLIVWFLWALGIFHIVVTVHPVYYYLVSHPASFIIVWSFHVHILLFVIISETAHWIYIARIWKITASTRKLIPVVMVLLVSANLAIQIVMNIRIFQSLDLETLQAFRKGPIVVWVLAISISINLLVSVSLGWTLARASTNLCWTNSNFSMLLAYFINTGASASVVSLLALITLLASSDTFIFLAMEIVLSQLHINSILGMINARHYFQPHKAGPPATLLLPSDTSSQHCHSIKAPQQLSKTINEVGLPLFQPSTKSEDIKMLEVVVKQEAHSSEI